MREHGYFELSRKGRVMVVVMQGVWNVEASQHLADEVLALAKQLEGEDWAILFDNRKWELSTQECFDLAGEVNVLLDGMNRTHSAVVLPDNLFDMARSFLNKIVNERAPGTYIRYFESLDEAWEWLASEGFD